jgi:aminoglycoside/choline kinase family phosphotransferase
MKKLTSLYVQWRGAEPVQVEHLPAAGSNRDYYRFTDDRGDTVIGAVGTSVDENRAFIYLAKHFTLRKLPVPKILAVSDDGTRYLQTDLGRRSLFEALAGGRAAGGRYTEEEKQLLRRTIAALPNLQVRGARGLDFSYCYPQAELDRTSVLFDLNYFKYCFLKATGLDFHELKLEANFQLMAVDLTEENSESFLYRDFQARNVMLSPEGEPYFIDFQGGRRGPVQYDVASFLWQASARYSADLRNELIDVYLESLKQYTEVNEPVFRHKLRLFVLFRTLQVLGAYGFRGYFERKEHFLKSIPPAMDNLRALLRDGACPYPYLNEVLGRMAALPQFAPAQPAPAVRSDGYRTTDSPIYKAHAQDGLPTFSKYDGRGPLVVRIYSFSYQKGIPQDTSGNGGGYVFDCRSTHNPGRYEPYKKLTGLDEPVIRFLEDDGEILKFLKDVYNLADRHVERYIQRGFTDLMFCFGCTGGQHRSVYSAQHLAQHLNEKYGIEVRVCHREQLINKVLPARRA